jgi:hypothetical protein
MGASLMAEESRYEHEEQAYENAGGDWKVEGKMFTFNQNIARQAPQRGYAGKKMERRPNQHH